MSGRRRKPQGGKCAEPEWRHARAVKAGHATAAAYKRAAVLRASRSPSKAVAWTAGYQAGYRRAAGFWRARLRRLQAACTCRTAPSPAPVLAEDPEREQ